jgi:hypothetical protein
MVKEVGRTETTQGVRRSLRNAPNRNAPNGEWPDFGIAPRV